MVCFEPTGNITRSFMSPKKNQLSRDRTLLVQCVRMTLTPVIRQNRSKKQTLLAHHRGGKLAPKGEVVLMEFESKDPPGEAAFLEGDEELQRTRPPSPPSADRKPSPKKELSKHPPSAKEKKNGIVSNEDRLGAFGGMPFSPSPHERNECNVDETSDQVTPPLQAVAATVPMAQELPEPHQLSFKNQVYDYDEWRRRNTMARIAPVVHEISNDRTTSGSGGSNSRDNATTSVTAQLISPVNTKSSNPPSVSPLHEDAPMFPAPRVISVKICKPIGPVRLSFRKSDEGYVKITEIHQGSVFQDTDVNVGQLVLAVNGCRVGTLNQTVKMIRSVLPGATLFLTARNNDPIPEICKLVIEPCFRHTPGIAFTDFHDDLLVRVSRVFKNGPFFNDDGLASLKRGDIVLSVNGVPVSNSHDARAAMALSLERGFTTDLYVLDHSKLVETVLGETKERFQAPKDKITLKFIDDSALKVVVDGSQPFELDGFWICATSCMIRDRSSSEVQPPIDQSKTMVYRKYLERAQNCRNFVSLFNQAMTRYLDNLAEAVCCENWRHKCSSLLDVDPSTEANKVAEANIEMAEVLEIPVNANEHMAYSEC